MSNNSSAPTPFGLGAQIFGGVTSPQVSLSGILSSPEIDQDLVEADSSDTESDSGSSEKSFLTAMAATTIEESPWKSAPSYLPIYLSTVSEYLPPQPKLKLPPGADIEDPSDDGKSGKDAPWAAEIYENSLDIDHIFERFTKRVAYEGEQCIR